MTFSDIKSAVFDECNYLASPATAVTTRVARFVNEGMRLMLSEPGLARLVDSDTPYTFASVAGQARYVVPEAVARILHIREITNDITLSAMDLGRYRHVDPDPASSSGTTTHFVPIGRAAVAVQPADASAVFVKSDAAGDTGTAYIEGVRSTGVINAEGITMTGVTAAGSGFGAFVDITDFYLSTAAVGNITLHEDSGIGTTLAAIKVGATRPRYYAFYLWPTPSAAVTYYVDYRRELTDLVNNTDEPPLPTDFHPALVAYAVSREKQKTDDREGAADALARYQKFLRSLKYQTQTLSDELPVMGRGALVGRSRLGAWFPADYYTRG